MDNQGLRARRGALLQFDPSRDLALGFFSCCIQPAIVRLQSPDQLSERRGLAVMDRRTKFVDEHITDCGRDEEKQGGI